jgi:hypothetical protein
MNYAARHHQLFHLWFHPHNVGVNTAENMVFLGKLIEHFNLYPIHQIATAIPLMIAALNDVRQNQISFQPGGLPSQLWYHPTLFEYLKYWMQQGVR